MTNAVNNTHNISSTPSPPSVTTNSSGLKKNTTTTRVASRGGGGGSGRNGSQACAACKYQRRKCAFDCPLAPYFPAEKQKDFLNAHKLFGVSNILKVLKNIAPFQKDNAMKALIFEANIRAGDPVGGCYRVILNLHRQINLYHAELQFVYREIFRAQAAAIQEQRNINTTTNSTVNFDLLPLHDLYEYNRSNSIYIGEGSSSQKGKELECFTSDEEFETKTIMRGSNGKQSFAEHEDVKPHFGNFHNYKGKGVATELRAAIAEQGLAIAQLQSGKGEAGPEKAKGTVEIGRNEPRAVENTRGELGEFGSSERGEQEKMGGGDNVWKFSGTEGWRTRENGGVRGNVGKAWESREGEER
ncbi:LOB domain-containing protein 22-like [Lycium barbarum]|uniref:LOB domain-containing protein 22-like n=1 Tax=Lycium barbarum TaxID=112863 RepID=UPI00293E887F|nr:LOB domain-containing protein 22-like [Lycium barbarum]